MLFDFIMFNSSLYAGSVQSNTVINTPSLTVSGTSFTEYLQANTRVNTQTLTVSGTFASASVVLVLIVSCISSAISIADMFFLLSARSINLLIKERSIYPDIELNLIGKPSVGNKSDYLHKLSELASLHSFIHISPPVARKNLPDLLNGNDVFIHAFQGSLDKTLIEATLAGLPVITINNEYLNETDINVTREKNIIKYNLLIERNNLKKIHCSYTQITLLDNLPKSLETLRCNHNKITSLDHLPNSLKLLNCQDTKITLLNNLPNSLKTVYRNYTQIDLENLKNKKNQTALEDKIEKAYSNQTKIANKIAFLEERRLSATKQEKVFIS